MNGTRRTSQIFIILAALFVVGVAAVILILSKANQPSGTQTFPFLTVTAQLEDVAKKEAATKTSIAEAMKATSIDIAAKQTQIILQGLSSAAEIATATSLAATVTAHYESVANINTATVKDADSTKTAVVSILEQNLTASAVSGSLPLENISTSVPSHIPTKTPQPPTKTSVLPTNTPKPPTKTPVPPTNTPQPLTKTPVPPTNTPQPPTQTLSPTSTNSVALSFNWETQIKCSYIENRVNNLNSVEVQVTGFISAKHDNEEEKTISEVPPQYQDCSSGGWCGPIEDIHNHFSNFNGVVWGTTWVHYQGNEVAKKSFGPSALSCNP